ncbi:MAG TPA: CAP domain-containing protein [Candidatus Saccharimonadales bacterium]|nr:CAP domain-containing protein [Candidatus Saccharimonadales bacterium]
MIRHKIVHHFLPHFLVDSEFAINSGHAQKLHHRAHAISTFSLFAYVQLVLVLIVSLYFVHLKAPKILGTATFSADQIIALTNQKRAQNGLGALSYNSQLAAAASAKAANMFAENYWAHFSPSGKSPWQFITAAGYRYVFAGENLARDFDNADAVVNAWMNSPSHRDNLLDKNFKEVGVAVVSGKLTGHDGILVVQEFGAGVSQQQAKIVQAPAVQAEQSEASSSAKEATESSQLTVNSSPKEESAPTINSEPITVNQTATVLASRQFSIAKIISFGLIAFIFLMFALELLITFKHEHLRVRPAVIAHLAILAFVLFALWYAVGGAIL